MLSLSHLVFLSILSEYSRECDEKAHLEYLKFISHFRLFSIFQPKYPYSKMQLNTMMFVNVLLFFVVQGDTCSAFEVEQHQGSADSLQVDSIRKDEFCERRYLTKNINVNGN